MVDSSQQQTDTETIVVPKELAQTIQEIISLYHHHNKQDVSKSLEKVITEIATSLELRHKQSSSSHQTQDDEPTNLQISTLDKESADDFLKSWDDIFNVQVYIDTDIFGERDPGPPPLVEADANHDETIIQHTDASQAYVQAWKEVAQSISNLPNDLFTRLWTTVEIAKIVECSPSSLRRARRNKHLPLKVKNLVLDCISHDGKRSLWFVRPA